MPNISNDSNFLVRIENQGLLFEEDAPAGATLRPSQYFQDTYGWKPADFNAFRLTCKDIGFPLSEPKSTQITRIIDKAWNIGGHQGPIPENSQIMGAIFLRHLDRNFGISYHEFAEVIHELKNIASLPKWQIASADRRQWALALIMIVHHIQSEPLDFGDALRCVSGMRRRPAKDFEEYARSALELMREDIVPALKLFSVTAASTEISRRGAIMCISNPGILANPLVLSAGLVLPPFAAIVAWLTSDFSRCMVANALDLSVDKFNAKYRPNFFKDAYIFHFYTKNQMFDVHKLPHMENLGIIHRDLPLDAERRMLGPPNI